MENEIKPAEIKITAIRIPGGFEITTSLEGPDFLRAPMIGKAMDSNEEFAFSVISAVCKYCKDRGIDALDMLKWVKERYDQIVKNQ
jgi:hypothetical protein